MIHAIDGPIILTACFTEHGRCDQSEKCTVREPLRKVHEAIIDLLNRITISDMAGDGSKIIGKLTSRADAPVPGAIPWLLLSTKSVGGRGEFSDVTSVQRIATHGGVAPAGDCPKTGTRARVEYTADYYFFTGR